MAVTTPRALATGVGSLPGDDVRQAVRMVVDELPDLPHLPELPDRGPAAGMVGRAVGMLSGLGADLQPAGWRLTDAPGVDQRRARSVLAEDLDALEEHTAGYAGPLKLQVTGPLTLAAMVERPRGDRILADHGGRRELAQSLAEGVAGHVADVARRVGGAQLVLQVDEPSLPAVLGGRVPTASGFGRHRSVHAAEAAESLGAVLAAAAGAGARPVVHCCAADVPVELIVRAGTTALMVDVVLLEPTRYDDLATAIEGGVDVWPGVVPTVEPVPRPGAEQLAGSVHRLWSAVGHSPSRLVPRTAVTPTCGLAGARPGWARSALSLARDVARQLSAQG
ncbi:MAG: methionine synthase [Nocardioidaceae bacterium]|jgi:methionine synthase II (cobalamin-independent)|nr:methionine synthase [Nocardioidaceae bacterium]